MSDLALTTVILFPHEVAMIKSSSTLVLIRMVEPQPEGEKLDDYLDGEWLGKHFRGLILPLISDLFLECPFGKEGEQLIGLADNEQFNLEIESIEVSKFFDLSEDLAKGTGVKPWWDADLCPDGTLREGESTTYKMGLLDELQANQLYDLNIKSAWMWVLKLKILNQDNK